MKRIYLAMSRMVMITILMFFVLLGVVASTSFAAPLPYTGPWTGKFTRLPLVPTPNAFRKAAFGAASVADGQLTGLLAAKAVAKAEATADPGLLGAEFASATVDFSRPFTLPPGGPYKLSLTASLDGELNVRNPLGSSSASVSAISCIGPVGGAAIVCVNNADHPSFTVNLAPASGVSAFVTIQTPNVTDTTPGFTVAPGKYELRGSLSTSASAGLGIPGVDAESLFFSTFETFGEYQAVPEPSTLILTGAGILGLFGYGWQRRKR